MNLNGQIYQLFQISTDTEFNAFALKIFHYQYTNNAIYQQYVNYHLNPTAIKNISHYTQIPFLPIEFFKTHQVICDGKDAEQIFTSSGTTAETTSKHYIADIHLYETSFNKCFRKFFGNPEDYLILALLPSYLEREGSSLVYMAEKLIEQSKHKSSGFYLYNYETLIKTIHAANNHKVILLGVTFGLLELAEKYAPNLSGVMVMETGGMKGRRKEIVREELHRILCSKFNVEKIYSEYGMTELLSQAYSTGEGIFNTPSWMKILIRDTNDPKTILTNQQTGGINIIDLANIYSCSFIATHDLGKLYSNGSFEVLGRFDTSDIRGCNLLITQ
jgi:phenylacetate-coenzyme A ligase PaaK-like adenylate-forming protein